MNLLLVDDNLYLRETLKDYIEFFYDDINITEAITGQQGLDIFRKKSIKFDIIISDEMMPIMTGSDFFSKIYDDIVNTNLVAILYSGQQFQELTEIIKAYPKIIMVDKIADPKIIRELIDQARSIKLDQC